MGMNVFTNQINAADLRALGNKQYTETLLMSDIVPAGGQKTGKIDISALGSFVCQSITGVYSCLFNDTVAIIDNGICFLRGQLIDSTGNRKLFNDYVPFNLILSPGRRKDIGAANVQGTAEAGAVAAADPAGQFLLPWEFFYQFSKNTNIFMEVKNASNVDISYDIAFHGIRVINQ